MNGRSMRMSCMHIASHNATLLVNRHAVVAGTLQEPQLLQYIRGLTV